MPIDFSDEKKPMRRKLLPIGWREFEIVNLLLSGQTLSDISKSLNLQTSTVGTHKARLFEKLGVTNLLELKEMATSYQL